MELNSDKWLNTVKEGALTFNVKLEDEKLSLLYEYASLLLQWNKRTNLTAITDPFEVAVKHIIDSLYPVNTIKSYDKFLDIGSGGGFPAIPIAIVNDNVKAVMVESSRKKVSFLKHVIRTLNLKGVSAVNMRCEEMAEIDEYRKSFDVVISRAFAELNTFVKLAAPFVKDDGLIIAMKGRDVEDEKSRLDSDLQLSIEKYQLPFLKSERAQVILKA